MSDLHSRLARRIAECLNKTELFAVGLVIDDNAPRLTAEERADLGERMRQRREEVATLFAEWQKRNP